MRLFLLVCVFVCGCSQNADRDSAADRAQRVDQEAVWYDQQRSLYYGIPVRVSFQPADEALAERLWQRLESVDDIFNDYRSDSEIGKINNAKKGAFPLSNDLHAAFLLSYQLAALTNNNFDITIGPLRNLWKQAAQEKRFPSKAELAQAQSKVGPTHYWIQDKTLSTFKDEIHFDFGGMIKGWVIDELAKELKNNQVTAALIQVGGETLCFGPSKRSDSRGHYLGIPNPLNPNTFYAVIADPGTGLSASTSGNYRQPIVIDGKAYYHIFDPKTGQPAKDHTLSVSVLFPQRGKNALADALSTVGTIMSIEDFFKLVESLGGEAMILRMDKASRVTAYQSEGWEHFVRP